MNRRTFHRAVVGAVTAGTLPRSVWGWPRPPVTGNAQRLQRLFQELSQFGRTEAGGVNRVAYTEPDRQAREWFVARMREAGLTASVDAAGNLVGRRAGSDAGLPPILTGSHIDSVPDGGRYDGNVGSLGALEIAWTLEDHGIRTQHPIEVVVFQNEEGGLYGSEALAGRLDGADLSQTSNSGKTIAEGIRYLGGDPDRLADVRRRPGDIAAYLELHIEQGGTLERDNLQIGVVEGIVGIEQWTVAIEGVANHAGTTPMDQRHDALLAAAQFIQAVNETARSMPGRQVATVGQIQAFPGAPNVIPGRVVSSLEIRDLDAETIRALYAGIETAASRIGRETGTTFTFVDRELDIVPQPTDERIRRAIEAAADQLGFSHRRMPSGAGHDAQSLAPLCPIGMIFVPSVGGISHSPREYTKAADFVNGVNVLLNAVLGVDAIV